MSEPSTTTLGSLLLFLTSLGLAAPGVAAMPEFYVESFGVGWRAHLPVTHREVDRLVLTLSADGGQVRLLARRATNRRLRVQTFLIMLARLPEEDAKPIDSASYDKWFTRALEAAVGGAPSVEKSELVTAKLGTARAKRRSRPPSRASPCTAVCARS